MAQGFVAEDWIQAVTTERLAAPGMRSVSARRTGGTRQRPVARRPHRVGSQHGWLSGCAHYRTLYFLRQVNRNETISRIEIVLTAFVDHTNKIVFSGSFIW